MPAVVDGIGMESTAAPAAGWFPDPGDPSTERWWSGNAWTEHTRQPLGAEAPAAFAPQLATLVEERPAAQEAADPFVFAMTPSQEAAAEAPVAAPVAPPVPPQVTHHAESAPVSSPLTPPWLTPDPQPAAPVAAAPAAAPVAPAMPGFVEPSPAPANPVAPTSTEPAFTLTPSFETPAAPAWPAQAAPALPEPAAMTPVAPAAPAMPAMPAVPSVPAAGFVLPDAPVAPVTAADLEPRVGKHADPVAPPAAPAPALPAVRPVGFTSSADPEIANRYRSVIHAADQEEIAAPTAAAPTTTLASSAMLGSRTATPTPVYAVQPATNKAADAAFSAGLGALLAVVVGFGLRVAGLAGVIALAPGIMGLGAWISGVVAIITGIVGLVLARRRGVGFGKALTGLLFGILVSVLIPVGVVLLAFAFVSSLGLALS